ncbi:Hypothetical predicted protein, partial [Pelobates cultripes]
PSVQCRSRAQSQPRPEPPLAFKIDLTSMVTDLKAFFDSEMTVLGEDLGSLTGWIRATEEDIHDIQIKQDSTAAQLLE